MNIFEKALIHSILDSKIKSGEINEYCVNDTYIDISKKNNLNKRYDFYKFNFSNLSHDELVKVLQAKIKEDIHIHFTKEIRNIKIRNIIK